MMQYQKHLPRKFYKIPIYFNLKSTNFFLNLNHPTSIEIEIYVYNTSYSQNQKKQTQKLEKKMNYYKKKTKTKKRLRDLKIFLLDLKK